MTMNNKDLITIFASFFNFLILYYKKINNHINHIINIDFFLICYILNFFK